jgi:hypothetical protein
VIVSPVDGHDVTAGDLVVRGLAWSGEAAVVRVDVAVGDGDWVEAALDADSPPFAWRRWELRTQAPGRGPIAIRSRATDALGNVQPERPEWNRLGYGANNIHAVVVHRR